MVCPVGRRSFGTTRIVTSMPFRYYIDVAERLVLAEKSGRFDGAALVESVRTLHADPAWRDDFDVIWDLSGLTGLIVMPEDLPPLVAVHAEHSCGYDALVVTRQADVAIAQLYAYLARRAGKPTGVYESLDEALKALNRPALSPRLHAWRLRSVA